MEYKKYSLLSVGESGLSWIQNFVGTLDEAEEKAKQIKKANNNKIEVTVVDELSSVVPQGSVPVEIIRKFHYSTDCFSLLNLLS